MDTYPGTPHSHPRRRLRSARADDGFTLVEMMIAILLLAIIMTAMVSVIVTTLTSMQREEQRVRATQIVQEQLERLRAIEWDCVAFDATDPDYAAAYNGNDTVQLDATACSDTSIAPDPSPAVRPVDGIDYTLTPHVYWIDDPEDGTDAAGTDADPQDYKEFVVEVAWTFRGQNFTYSDSSTRVPTIEEVPLAATAAPAAFEITFYEVDPTIVQIDDDGDTLQAITVTVETSSAASLVQLVVGPPATFATASLTDISGGAGTRWQLVIPDEEDDFPAGDHVFTVTADDGAASDTESQTVTFAEVAGSPVVVNAPLLSPAAPICVANNRKSHFNVVVTVDVDGLSLTDEVDISWTDNAGSAVVSPVATIPGGARFQGTIPANSRFNGSTTTLTIDARRISDNAVAQGTFTVSVVKHNNSANC